MKLSFEIHGQCCDLALHPVSEQTAKKINKKGSAIYKEKYMNWWRAGKTTTCGMRLDKDTLVRVTLDGKSLEFDASLITRNSQEIRRSMYLGSKAKYLAVMGYDDEVCSCVWTWEHVSSFAPERFNFFVQQWDRIMGIPGYYVVDNVLFNERFADSHNWCESKGFNLIQPKIIDLDALRAQRAKTILQTAGA
ncbi:hypothetical protein PCS_01195 [Desulfocurvibacter africanus PCS]|uniref:Uncharacterized protein n=1 Tax=Desulfocurvibacter africanus PCS TaxID=1262666 RepID=M5Q202_DESAF|nr:hypothetical protein [Desulfocurvibacter africanus]EMG38026.1 hypothetical protein PCS_01195 [Desulfocurvibacter africanus PCS]